MIQKQTVLILDAGASAHLGFPLGKTLIDNIVKLVYSESHGFRRSLNGKVFEEGKANSDLLSAFLNLAQKKDGTHYSPEDVKDFAQRLQKAQSPSIDFFLEKNPQYGLLGKICIAFCISRFEDETSKQYAPWNYFHEIGGADLADFGWYRYLWHKMLEGCETLDALKKNKITVITFNYDRSLEYYLFRAAQNFFGIDDGNAVAQVFESVRIKHVYGKLGRLPWENSLEKLTGDFNPFNSLSLKEFFHFVGDLGEYGMSASTIPNQEGLLSQDKLVCLLDERNQFVSKFKQVANEIKIFSETVDEQKKKEYFNDINKAEKVYFLGFGYHDLNMKALGLSGECKCGDGSQVFGTAVNMEDIEVDLKKYSLCGMFGRNPKQMDIRNQWENINKPDSCKIKSFFKNVKPLE